MSIDELLDTFGISEVLELSGISEQEVLEVLVKHGYIELPFQDEPFEYDDD